VENSKPVSAVSIPQVETRPPRSSFRLWQIYSLLGMTGAAAAVWVTQNTQPVALLLLSAAVLAAGFVGLTLHQSVAGFLGKASAPEPVSERKRELLEREKALTLRSIKELEFDRAMGKIGDADFSDLSSRLRARALSLMQDLARVEPDSAPSPGPAPTATRPSCAKCGTANEADARFCKNCGTKILALVFLVAFLTGIAPVIAQTEMPDLRQVSGKPLPSPEVPAGTVTVRVIRGSFANNLVGQTVEVTVDGKKRTMTTDASGRVEISGLRPGTRLRAVTVVAGERLESEEITVGSSGLRVMLVATDPEDAKRATENQKLAQGPAVKGLVVFGPESRIVAEMAQDRLTIYYLFDVLNTARSPVDIGGPLILDLPSEARGAGLLQDSTKRATVNGARVTVLGPFAPGTTPVRVAFELPPDGRGTAEIASNLPAALQQLIVIVPQTGGLDLVSSQIAAKREVTDQGERILVGTGPAIPAGRNLSVAITGLPHHANWPRYLALILAGSVMTAGIWSAAKAGSRRTV
jgi:hypothetical protein